MAEAFRENITKSIVVLNGQALVKAREEHLVGIRLVRHDREEGVGWRALPHCRVIDLSKSLQATHEVCVLIGEHFELLSVRDPKNYET